MAGGCGQKPEGEWLEREMYSCERRKCTYLRNYNSCKKCYLALVGGQVASGQTSSEWVWQCLEEWDDIRWDS